MTDKESTPVVGNCSGFCSPIIGDESKLEKLKELSMPIYVNLGGAEGFQALTAAAKTGEGLVGDCSGFCSPIF